MLVVDGPHLSLRRRVREGAGVFRPHAFQPWHSFRNVDDSTEPFSTFSAWLETHG